MFKKNAILEIDGFKVGEVPVLSLPLFTNDLFMKCYNIALKKEIVAKVIDAANEMLGKMRFREIHHYTDSNVIKNLRTAYQDAIKNSEYDKFNYIGIMSIDILDKLLEMRKNGAPTGKGFWRVLESDDDEVVNENYMFIRETGRGKHNEGFLISRDSARASGIKNFKPHRYSIKDKKYIYGNNGLVETILKSTIKNESFLRNVMMFACVLLCRELNNLGSEGNFSEVKDE